MDGLFVLLGLVVLGIPVAVFYLLVSHIGLKREVRALRDELSALTGSRTDLAVETSETQPDEETADPPEVAPMGPWEQVGPASSGDAAETISAQVEAPAAPPRAVVFRAETFRRLAAFLIANWFYVVSATSLALAGIFLVQYGVENGFLPPVVRVLAALAFGAGLVGTGEIIRRRHGDGEEVSTAFLPSVFSGAGIVTLFGATLAARRLYDLIGAEAALGGMGLIALGALILGWFHGPLLAAIGILGAFAAPFVVGGSSDDPGWLYAYFFVVTALGLGIDTVRRWAWISVLALILAYGAGYFLVLGAPSTAGHFSLFLGALVPLAVCVPMRALVPRHEGTMVAETLTGAPDLPWPEFPTRVAFAAVLTSGFGLVWASQAGTGEFWLSITILTALSLAGILASLRAPALQDAALIPGLGLLAGMAWEGSDRRGVWQQFQTAYAENPEADAPLAVSILLALAALVSCLALWRALAARGSDARFALVWAGVAALTAPAAAIALELLWAPAEVIGAYPWALHAAALAALMVGFAERLARADGPEDRLRMSLPLLSALSAIAFAFTILFAETALTLAFVVTVLAAAALDRVYRIPQMTAFITVGVATIGYRLVADPGLDFAVTGSLAEVLATYVGALAGLMAALALLTPLARPVSRTVLESAAWATGGLLVSVLLFRWLATLTGGQDDSHWAMGLYASIWLGLMAAQIARLSLGGWLRLVRLVLAGLFGLIGAGFVFLALGPANPLFAGTPGPVLGPPVLNTLALAYLAPAAVLALTGLRLSTANRWIRMAALTVALGLAVFWVFVAIRHLWQGAEGMPLDTGMSQPELYSYTVALLVTGAGLFYQSLTSGSGVMRRAGLAVIALAVAKVFLVDASGLTGLTRVFSFLLLGLALAGLAWLGRWAEQTAAADQAAPDDDK